MPLSNEKFLKFQNFPFDDDYRKIFLKFPAIFSLIFKIFVLRFPGWLFRFCRIQFYWCSKNEWAMLTPMKLHSDEALLVFLLLILSFLDQAVFGASWSASMNNTLKRFKFSKILNLFSVLQVAADPRRFFAELSPEHPLKFPENLRKSR